MKKRGIIAAISIGIVGLLIVLFLFNKEKQLENIDEFPDLKSITYASVTSIEHYPQEENFIYRLSSTEYEELLQVLSSQKVSKAVGEDKHVGEYHLLLYTDDGTGYALLQLNNEQVDINNNKLYDLKGNELYNFISKLNRQE